MSPDCEKLIITNKKPVDDEYLLEADPLLAQRKIAEIREKKKKDYEEDMKRNQSNFNYFGDMFSTKLVQIGTNLIKGPDTEATINTQTGVSDANGLEDEDVLKQITNEDKHRKFFLKRSMASCHISDIQGIIFGGFSSRFWIFRKHINALTKSDKNSVPFYAWECVTLVLKDREIDLVIPNEERMNQFLKLLVYKMQTLDGTKDSAVKLKNELLKQKIKKYKRKR